MRWQALLTVAGSVAVVGVLFYVVFSLTSTVTPESGGTYVEGLVGSPVAINPLVADFNDIDRDIASLVFSGLTRINQRGEPEPDLAESWDISEDRRSYVFHLRRDVTWHDGRPFTADDVVTTIRLVQDRGFSGPEVLAQAWRGIVVERPNPHSVKFTLPAPFAPFLSYASLGLLPAHRAGSVRAQDLRDWAFNARPIGTGPYRLTEGNLEWVQLEANSQYYLSPPYLSRIRFRFFPSYGALLAAARQREVRGLAGITPEDLPALRKDPDLQLYITSKAGYTLVFLNLSLPFFQERSVRQALLYGLDRQKLIEQAVSGQGLVADSPIPPGSWAHDPAVPAYAPNPAKAAQLLDEAGWKRGADGIRERLAVKFQFNLLTNNDRTRVRVAEEISRQLRALGVVATVSASGAAGLIENFMIPRRFDAVLYGLEVGPDPDLYSTWHSSQIGPDGMNFSSYRSLSVDRLLEEARQTPDQERRRKLYADFQTSFAEDVPALLLYHPLQTYAVDKAVKGIRLGLLHEPAARLGTINEWHVKTRRVFLAQGKR